MKVNWRFWSAQDELKEEGNEVPDEQQVSEDAVQLVASSELIWPAAVLTALVSAVVVTAVLITYSAFEYRILFNQHQKLVQQWDQLQVEWAQLVLEQSAWGANNRVEQQATKKLVMVVPDTSQMEIVRDE